MSKIARKPAQQGSQANGGKPRLFVYGRFSSPKQAEGDSLRRQMAYAHTWAEANGFVVDESLTMFDHGLSAYKGTHVAKGALGVFLAAIREKALVQAGDVLLVESLDRLSRAEPLEAQEQFREIIHAGVMIVTANDNQRYSRELLRENPSPLFLALATMIRAHEESSTKSKRVRGAIEAQCKGWIAGTWRGRLSAGKDPVWTRYDEKRKKFVLVPGVARSLRALISHFKAGQSPHRALQMLAAAGLPCEGFSNAARVYTVLGSRLLLGEREVSINGDQHTLQGYYPAILTEHQFAELQFLRKQRGRRPGKTTVPGLITGLGICRCGYCGFAMNGQNIMSRSRTEAGLPQNGHRRLLCGGALSVPKCTAGSVSVVPVENALMDFCADQFNLDGLFKGDDRSGPLAQKLERERETAAKTERKITRLTHALADSDDDSPASVLKMLRELEAQKAKEQDAVTTLEHELAALRGVAQPAVAGAWSALREDVRMLDYDARVAARQLVADTFTEIRIFHRGYWVGDENVMRILLESKRGVLRELSIDRLTGALLSSHDVTRAAIEKALKAARARMKQDAAGPVKAQAAKSTRKRAASAKAA